ncbi:hypothetical protein [Mycoplasma hafezii]|uniref:hypothetical protein n=1 Tax=Mycoplasma hafezii TaxID=525886 RepID=UPI003CF702FE
MNKKLFFFLSTPIVTIPSLISVSCNDKKPTAEQIEIHSKLDAKFLPSQLTFNNLQNALKDAKFNSQEYNNLITQNSLTIINNIKNFRLLNPKFFLYEKDGKVLNSRLYQHQIGLIKASDLDDPSQAWKHKHYTLSPNGFKLSTSTINHLKVFESNNPEFKNIIFLNMRNVVLEIDINQNNDYILNPRIIYFRDDIRSNIDLDQINKYFNYKELTEQLVNEYEQDFVANYYGPASLLKIS